MSRMRITGPRRGGIISGENRRLATRERDEKIAADPRTLRAIAADWGLTYQAVWKIKQRMDHAA